MIDRIEYLNKQMIKNGSTIDIQAKVDELCEWVIRIQNEFLNEDNRINK